MDIQKSYEIAKNIYFASEDKKVCETLEAVFPQLKEQTDERILKAIIEFFELQDDNTTYSFIPKKDILDWLYRQADKKSVDNMSASELMDLAVEKWRKNF